MMMKKPSDIKILGGKGRDAEPTILSQSPTPPGQPRILDKSTRQEPGEIEVVVHEEVIREDDEVRSGRMPDAPEVRIRHSPTAGNFEKIKRGEEL